MIKLSDTQVQILGRPNFACAKIAKVLIQAGQYENKEQSAEYEQAVWIHWASNLLQVHGDEWKVEGEAILKQIVANLLNKRKCYVKIVN